MFCDLCGQDIKPRGWTTHQKACETNADKKHRDQAIVDAIRQEKLMISIPALNKSVLDGQRTAQPSRAHTPIEARDYQHDIAHDFDVDFSLTDHFEPEPMDASAPPTYSLDDIKVEHHPNSGIKAQIHPFNNFHCHPATSLAYTTPNNHPWRPFQSRLEFEVAELALEVGLNNEQTDHLINICHQCSLRKDSFMLKNHKDIHSKWEAASHQITKFTKDVISVPYNGKMQEFDVYYRDLWDLATDLLRDPNLFPHFQFDAQHLSKFDGQTFVRFVDEPFTAEDFGMCKYSQLPQDAKPLAFILYADKTRLSLFGTAKGYLVVMHLANLPTDIRNRQGVGSGYIVGWLPIHPNQVMSITFADSSIHEDISKMIIYATHNILTEEASPLGYLLVRCQYIMATEEDDKNWNFPKLHMITHLFDDIEAKGVTRNYNTKPNEQMHRPLKDWYQHWTNFKNIAEQILHIDHWLLVADDIHHRIFDLDEYVISQCQANDIDEDANEDDPDSEVLTNPIRHVFGPLDGSMHVKFGSREAPQTFGLIENSHKDDIAFSNFHVKLNSFLNVFLPASNIPLPDGKRIHLLSTHTITTCRLLHVNYESMVDWRQYTNYLQCNPKFFNAPHFDCVFIQTNQKVILGHLLLLFECPVGDNVYNFEKTSTLTFLEFEQNCRHRQSFSPPGLSSTGHF
ncbi:hypothetical protein BDR06DRAFT_966783 [Suillus hirtellus]|nr:hypothetical protein BDR06DRAFT_966783 [Suillus hirtellus]